MISCRQPGCITYTSEKFLPAVEKLTQNKYAKLVRSNRVELVQFGCKVENCRAIIQAIATLKCGDACPGMKRKLEQMVAHLHGKATGGDRRPDTNTIPSLGPQLPTWAKMELDGTIVVQHFDPHFARELAASPSLTIPRSDPGYETVLREFGPLTPGDAFRQVAPRASQ